MAGDAIRDSTWMVIFNDSKTNGTIQENNKKILMCFEWAAKVRLAFAIDLTDATTVRLTVNR